MSIKNSVMLEFGYTNTDFKRTYTIDGLSAAALPNIESKILAINASLTAGTDDGLGAFFRSDDFNASTNTGTFNKITSAKIESVEETYIFGGNS